MNLSIVQENVITRNINIFQILVPLLCLGLIIFTIVIAWRFMKAHEEISKSLKGFLQYLEDKKSKPDDRE